MILFWTTLTSKILFFCCWDFKFFLYLNFFFFFNFIQETGKTIHHKAKELLAMIFLAVKDFKTILLPCYMHEFILTLWCGKIRQKSFSLLCPIYDKQHSFSLLQKHEGCVGLQTQKVEVELWAYHQYKGGRGITIFFKTTDLANKFIPKITLGISSWSFNLVWVLSLMFLKQNVTINYSYVYQMEKQSCPRSQNVPKIKTLSTLIKNSLWAHNLHFVQVSADVRGNVSL